MAPSSSSSSSSSSSPPQPITVSLHDLTSSSVSLETLEAAFGPDSLGILLVKDLPPPYAELRRKVLSSASRLAALSEAELQKLEVPEARWNIGWSRGRERLKGGEPDLWKGSFYARVGGDGDGGAGGDGGVMDEGKERRSREEFAGLRDMVGENVWPEEDVLGGGFRRDLEELCALIVDVAGLVARSVDGYAAAADAAAGTSTAGKVEVDENGEDYREEGRGRGGGGRGGSWSLEEIVRGSVVSKARLLHYYPPPPPSSSPSSKADEDGEEDDWCGLHTDLGALTGLTSNMFVDESLHSPTTTTATTAVLPELDTHPDPKAGLWIKDRLGRTTKVDIPRDCLAFQTGMALEGITKGKFRAVPHFVRGGSSSGGSGGSSSSKTNSGGDDGRRIARNTLAVFTQPNLWEMVDEEKGLNFAGLCAEVFGRTY